MTQTFTPIRPIWCAGCGDFGVKSALEDTLDRLNIPRHRTLILTGIGCSGTVQNNMECYGYHALHGRVLPTATGAKLANPQLAVVAVGGDGDGFAIGAGHLVHTFKRNPSITYIVMNNATYGLTKGQPSPTSPTGYKQNIEEDLDPILLGLSLPGSTFLARGFSGWPAQLDRLMMAAVEHSEAGKGLAFFEIISPCVTYNDTYRQWRAQLYDVDEDADYNPRDRAQAFSKAIELRQQGRLPAGLLYEGERPALEAAILEDGKAPPALQSLDVQEHMEDYRQLMQSFVG